MQNDQSLFSNLPTPPGALLVRELEFGDIGLPEFAAAIGQPVAVAQALADGELAVDPDLAADLERVLGISAQLWLNLEDKYRATLARLSKPATAAHDDSEAL